MANEVNIDPRYSKYSNKQIEELLDRVKNPASEEDVRNIVRNYTEPEPEPEEEEEESGE